MTSETHEPGSGRTKLAQQVASSIETEITTAGWPVGEVLGSETELRERFGVSRAVLREAIRILENHGVAEMRKGRGGGLTVRRPEVASLARAAALHLDYEAASLEHLADARLALESAALELAFSQLDEGGRVALRAHMQMEHDALESTGFAAHAHGFHRLLTRLAHNPVLTMCTEMLLDVQQRRQRELWADDDVPTRFSHRSVESHQRIVDALLAGDLDGARHELTTHLGGLAHGRTTSLCGEPTAPASGKGVL